MVTDKKPEPTEELETAIKELEGLRQERGNLAQELKSRDTQIIKLEQALASKDSEIATLKQAVAETDSKLTEVSNALSQAVASYKTQMVESNPGVLAELITGDTIDEVNESLKNARALIDRVRQEMEAEASRTKIPAGAPQRAPLDLSTLSPREKIQYAIGGER